MENSNKKSVDMEKFSEKNVRVPSHPFYNNDRFWNWESFKSGSPELEERLKCKTLKEYLEKYGKKDNQKSTQ